MSVEFKLFGELTLKQFLYVGSGGVLAYITLASGLVLPVKILLAVFFGGAGAALALLPINNRPLEVWVGNFIQAMISPTKRVWKKGENPNTPKVVYSSDQYNKALATSGTAHIAPTVAAPQVQASPDDSFPVAPEDLAIVAPVQPAPIQPQPFPTPQAPMQQPPVPTQPATSVPEKISTEQALNTAPQPVATPQPVVPAPVAQQPAVASEPQSLPSTPNNTTMVTTMDKQNNGNNLQDLVSKQNATTKVPQTRQTLSIDLEKLRSNSQNTTGFEPKPNVLKGIVKNSSGNLVAGAIVIIKRKENSQPARAMVTNQLGEFETTTALDNGNYLIDISHDSKDLPLYEVAIDGSPVPPLQFQFTA